MTELKVGRSYQTATGFIIPRSKFSDDKANRYAIFEILTLGDNGHYTKKQRNNKPPAKVGRRTRNSRKNRAKSRTNRQLYAKYAKQF